MTATTTTRTPAAPYKVGDRVNVTYYGGQGTSVAMNREVLDTLKTGAGDHRILVSMPDDAVHAADRPGFGFTAWHSGHPDFVTKATPPAADPVPARSTQRVSTALNVGYHLGANRKREAVKPTPRGTRSAVVLMETVTQTLAEAVTDTERDMLNASFFAEYDRARGH